MNQLVRFLIVIFVILKGTQCSLTETSPPEKSDPAFISPATAAKESSPPAEHISETKLEQNPSEARSIDLSYQVHENEEELSHPTSHHHHHHEEFAKKAKPLKNIFMGIYKNYKTGSVSH